MISRVAESCFWLLRYMERAESMARLLQVNRSFLLDVELPEGEKWFPVLKVSGEHKRFPKLYPDRDVNDSEAVQHYLTWDEQCPVGILVSLQWARENARKVREMISLEMWESINQFWHWLKGGAAKKVYRKDPDDFYRQVKDSVALFQGICHNTMLHEEPFDFMRLGMLLERADQTARIMDVKYHLLGPTSSEGTETPFETAQWMALLRSCSAKDNFFRKFPVGFKGLEVVMFLFKEEAFPRSIYHSLTRSWNFLKRIQNATGNHGIRSAELLVTLVDDLHEKSAADILEIGLHKELTRVIEETTQVCNAIHSEFFDPPFAGAGT